MALGALLGSPLGAFGLQTGLGIFGSFLLDQNKPEFLSPSAGLGFDTPRPLSATVSTEFPDVRAAAGPFGQVSGTPQGVAQSLFGDRQRAFDKAQEAETEGRGAIDRFTSGLDRSVSRLRAGQTDFENTIDSNNLAFDSAQRFSQVLPGIIRATVTESIRALRGFTEKVAENALAAQQNLGDFVVQKMEGMRAGIDGQFEVATRQALDNLNNLPGGVSPADRNAIRRAMSLEKGRTIAEAYKPVLAEETARLIDLNVKLSDTVAGAIGTAVSTAAGIAASGVNAQIGAGQLFDAIATHRTAMVNDLKIAKWNLGQFAEDLQLRGNQQVFDMVQALPRPFLVMSDISNFLLEQYYGLVESENTLEQAQFGNVQAVLSPFLSGTSNAINTLASRAEAESERSLSASNATKAQTGQIVSGVAEATGSIIGGALAGG